MKLSKIITFLTVFIIFNIVSLFLIADKVSAAQIYCKLPNGEVLEMYKSECKSKEGVVVTIEEAGIADEKKSDCSKFEGDTGLSMFDKIRCKLGYKERKKGKKINFGEKIKNIFKKKN